MKRTIDRFGKPFVNDTKIKDGNARSEVARNITDFGDPSVVAEMPPVMAASIVETEINNENADAVISDLVLKTKRIVASTKDDKEAVGQSRDDDKITKKVVKNIYTKDVNINMDESFCKNMSLCEDAEDEEEIETEDEIEVVEKGDKSSDNPMKRWEMKFDGVLRDLEVDNPCTVFNVVQNRLDSAETFTTAAKTIFYHSESDCLKAETLKIKKLKTFNTPKGFRVKVLVSKNNYIGSRELNDENSTPNGVIASLREVKPVRQPRYSSQLISYDISTISIVLPTTDGRLAEKIAELFKLPITEDTKRAKAYGVPRCVKITIPYDIMDVHFVDYLKSVGRTFEDTQSW